MASKDGAMVQVKICVFFLSKITALNSTYVLNFKGTDGTDFGHREKIANQYRIRLTPHIFFIHIFNMLFNVL